MPSDHGELPPAMLIYFSLLILVFAAWNVHATSALGATGTFCRGVSLVSSLTFRGG